MPEYEFTENTAVQAAERDIDDEAAFDYDEDCGFTF